MARYKTLLFLIMQKLADISVQFVKGVGPVKKKLLERLGIESIEDLLYFFPRRYEDRRNLTPIAKLQPKEWQTVTGKILTKSSRRSWHTKKHVTEMIMEDESGRIKCIWFNQSYLERYLTVGKKIVCYGRVDVYKERMQIVSPEYEMIQSEEDEHLSLRCIVPIYPLTRGVTQRYLRKIIHACLDCYKEDLKDELAVSLRNKHHLLNIKHSICGIHFPEDFKQQQEALRRVSFEEFYFFQISVILRRLSITQEPGVAHRINDAQVQRFIRSFPFKLTGAQERVIGEIRQDMQKSSPMLRLLQGDVGCGKTLVALFGCVSAFNSGYQSCVMAPTEILARQHYENITKMLGGVFKDMKIAFLSSTIKKTEKETLYQQIKEGKIDLVVGTHALINEETTFNNLSFVVIDEQHKFGVRQRALLAEKGNNPDVLIMTATPIPRTLCITLYGDLDVSIIDEIPPGRGKVKTSVYTQEQVQDAYEIIRRKVGEGRQVYVVYPIIEESEKVDLKAANVMFKHFKSHEFKDLRIGLVHGQLKQEENKRIMHQFKNNEIDILVATTVVEVGVDVPNASVMVIEHAQRFGLAQLHQLRGRIGRGREDGLCLLISNAETDEANQRLKAIVSTTDGFKIAQYDLEIRGPGRYFGRHQHGLNELKVANPMTQLDILKLARKEAIALTQEDVKLIRSENEHIKKIIVKRYPTYLTNVKGG